MYRIPLAFSLILFLCSCQSDGSKGAVEDRSATRLYRSYCAACHGALGHMRQGRIVLTQSILEKSAVSTVIRRGRGMMPPFESYFSEEEIAELSEYVISLRKPRTPL